MVYVVASDILAPFGQAAAIFLAIYMFVFILIGMAISVLLTIGFTWVREKSELVKKLRPTVESVNTTIDAGDSETLPAVVDQNNKLLQTIHTIQLVQVEQKARDVQKQVNNIESKVDQGTDRIAEAVIEFRARTVMAQSMLKAFFLPGLVKQKPRSPLLLPNLLDTSGSAKASVSVDGPGGQVETSNIVVTQQTLLGAAVQPAGVGEFSSLESEGSKRSDNAPGH